MTGSSTGYPTVQVRVGGRTPERQTNRDPIATRPKIAAQLAPRRRHRPAVPRPDAGDPGRFLLYPLVYGIVLSLHETKGFNLTAFVGLDHYARAIFGDSGFHRSLSNTMLFTGAR